MITQGLAIIGAAIALHGGAVQTPAHAADAACPTGVPVQTITVDNQANVQPKALALVERATVAQSMQIHAAWGTPCVRFGPGGWVFTLTDPSTPQPTGGVGYPLGGHHFYGPQGVYADIETGGNDPAVWPRAFTHEVAEALADPTLTVRWRLGLTEICDPVEELTYPVDGVQVSDFALPAYFTSGAGPWDEANQLTGAASFG